MKERIAKIKEHIERAIKISGRNNSVSLMAVSKNHPYEAVLEALNCGITLFGENKVQELSDKFPHSHPNYHLHMIGHLQSNKVKKVLPFVDSIDSVDSIKLITLINKEAKSIDKEIEVLLEINTSKEEAKSGFLTIDEVYRLLDESASFTHVKVKGLMTIGPLSNDEYAIKTSFNTLREYQNDLIERYPQIDLNTLSMGMSQDYLHAIEMGSTIVRIGTAIFGSRGY
ncbi:MAG: YggS family pyridoxal phosphate-dependent enzyme [Spirochaetia bacterium]|nr:YggS family pyridoxal phosphate-dependent enzyme [Spirochaetia bacterium]